MFATILGVAGCEVVFPLVAPDSLIVPMDAAPYDPCGAAYDDPGVRYAVISSPNPALPWPWADARAECRSRGMDLTVYNDDHEAGQVDGADGWPYWIGETVDPNGWTSIDGCKPFFGDNARSSPTQQCGATTAALEITATTCDGASLLASGAIVTAALCETPRPVASNCLPRDPALSTYTVSPGPMTFQEARTFCSALDAHVAVIDSLAELRVVSNLTLDGALPRLWLGTTFEGAAWATETRCPAVFSWTNNRPDFTGGGTCAATVVVPDPESGKVKLDGFAVTSCNDGAVYALCESS